MSLRVIFMATPDFSVPTLNAIVEAGHEIVACYSQPPRPAGRRGLEKTKSPVHQAAENLGIPVFTPTSLKAIDAQQHFASLGADVAVVVAYGLLLPQAILDAPRLGCYNGHASKLPRWRGAAPIQRAIMAGDKQTAAMVMKMDIGLDTGPIALAETIEITDYMTAGELHDILSDTGAKVMVRALADLEKDQLPLTPQPEDGITYAKKIEKSESRIDWNRSAGDVHNHIRGLSPFPGAWCEMEIGGKMQRVKMLNCRLSEAGGAAGAVLDDQLTIACQSGSISPKRLQRAGKGTQNIDEFLRGNKIEKGAIVS